MSNKYFEVTGKKLKAQVFEWAHRCDEIRQARYRFSRRVGGKRDQYVTLSSVLGGEQFGICFTKMPDPKIWRHVNPRCGGPVYWTPRLTLKAGKELAAQMTALRVPSGELTKIIKMKMFNGLSARSPGFRMVGERIFIIAPDDYKPIRGIKRISDLQFERLTA
jgi:hypothetical protein